MSPARPCVCPGTEHQRRLVALTGGPGAGKTAVLEVLQRELCAHCIVLPEAASILFRGGFPRGQSVPAHKAAQVAIFRVQRELEWLALSEGNAAVVFCDRGTVDGLAYWPEDGAGYWRAVGSAREQEIARYAAVIHLRTPRAAYGYSNGQDAVRIETADQAAVIDQRIEAAWQGHPRRALVGEAPRFGDKLARALDALRTEVPGCCSRT